jgi:tetratricopeptide (TPR) repeat protein
MHIATRKLRERSERIVSRSGGRSTCLLLLLAALLTQGVEGAEIPTLGDPQGQGTAPRAEPSVASLLQQGKSLYRIVRLKEALEKFEAALQLEPANDEALGLAAITAFRLDNQRAAQNYFARRAELPEQKESVRAFCYYRLALSQWRELHDLMARSGQLEPHGVVYRLPESGRQEAERLIESGLSHVEQTLELIPNYPEAFNIRNLLHSEAALLALNEEDVRSHREAAISSLIRSLELMEQAALTGRRPDVADFSQPTIRVGEFPVSPEDDSSLTGDGMLERLVGGRPLQRQVPAFPVLKASKPDATEAGPIPGGAGEPESPSVLKIKVEILVSLQGEVVFARVIDGRPEYNPAALVAVREWKFEPARLEGRPVQVSALVTFEVPLQRRP